MQNGGSMLFIITVIIFLSMLAVIYFDLPKWFLVVFAGVGLCCYIKKHLKFEGRGE